MNLTTILLFLILILTSFAPADFITDQKKHERVKTAYTEKGAIVKAALKKNGVDYDNVNVVFVAYKDEQVIDLYAKTKVETKYLKIASFDICAKSGLPGPKSRAGDYQVPEGFYHIDRFNATSNYYLSLGINYPNQADRKRSNASNLGGDIFIHGHCVTIGCLPMTDDKIKEIYVYALQATQSGQANIPVYIFPFKMTDSNVTKYSERYKQDSGLVAFWKNLKIGHDLFLNDLKELNTEAGSKGNYEFN